MTWRKSAGVRCIHTSEASQRLNAGDLMYAYLVGLFEGDGYFSVSKNGKYIAIELGIELSIKDIKLVFKIKDLLGVGVISYRNRNNIETVILRVRNKNHLINFVIPIFDKYPMFSDKQFDYLRFKNILISNMIYSKDLVEYKRSHGSLNSIESILAAAYFPAWLVGFIEAEGCFSIYPQSNNRSDLVASFDISQTNGYILISAIKEYLKFTTTIHVNKTNNSKLKISSIRSVENIIKFLQNMPIKLLGNKRLQYILWVKQLRSINRYSKKIILPIKY